MTITFTTSRHKQRLLMALVGIFMSFFLLFGQAPSAAHAESTPGSEQEVTDFYFGGVIKFDDVPVEGVDISIKGNGESHTTTTDADGRWRIYVEKKDKYTLTVDESTLPEGVIVDGASASQEVTFGLTGTKIVNLFLGEGVRETTGFAEQLLSRLVGGLNFGLLLALASMGAALIFGTTRLSNFAHAEMVTWGALVLYVVSSIWQAPLWVGVIASVLAGALLGWSLDRGLWRPLRRRGLGVVQLMIVSIGLSLAIRYLFQFFIGGGTKQLPGASPQPLELGPIQLSYIDLISMGVSIVAIIAMAYFLQRTRTGKATRAISDNPQLAAASGIDVDKVIRTVWVIAGVLAAVSGILWAYFRPGLKWDMGTQMLLLMFAAITLGGLGTAYGALIGSIIVGVTVEISTLWIPSDLKYAGALIILILVLLFRPQGILGRKERLG